MMTLSGKHRILIVDDEPDVHAVTKLTLRRVKFAGRRVELVSVHSGAEAIADIRANPHTAVILLDVVMESEGAGLEAADKIRNEVGNHHVRILLRTGQPGAAPEKQCIDDYDIDGYLPKTELSSTRLYAAVRTALKAFTELMELERHRSLLAYIHESVASLRSFEALEVTLQRILAAAATVSGASNAILDLETFESEGEPRQSLLHLSDDDQAAEAIAEAHRQDSEIASASAPILREGVLLLPLVLPRDLGRGWLHLECDKPDELVLQVLTVLSTHAANALYATVAQAMLEAREGPFYDNVSI